MWFWHHFRLYKTCKRIWTSDECQNNARTISLKTVFRAKGYASVKVFISVISVSLFQENCNFWSRQKFNAFEEKCTKVKKTKRVEDKNAVQWLF